MLIIMWWKFIIILPFLFFRRRHLVHKLRFTILGVLICYTIDLVVPRIFLWVINFPSDPRAAAEWAQVWMFATTMIKIMISLVVLFFLCKYYEKPRQPFHPKRSEAGAVISIYQSNKAELIRYGIIAAAVGFVSVAVLTIMSIKRSTSSTAAIGYLFVPMISLLWSVPFFAFGYSVGYLWKWHSSLVRKFNVTVVLAFVVSIVLFLAGAKFAVEGIYLSSLVHEIKSMNEAELRNTIEKPFFGKNKFVLGAIVQNKAASGELLDIIGKMDEKDLHERMWSLFDIMGDNTHGLAVMRLVARHPNVLPETLEHLAKSSNDYVLGDVAGNEKTSVATLIRLSQRKTYLIDWGLARNPSTPSDILNKLSSSDNEYTRAPVAQNPNTLLKDLEKLAVDHEWNVRRSVAQNPQVSVDLLNKLKEDKDERVRHMIVFNKQVTADILTKLTEDSNSGVQQSAKDALRRLSARQ